MEKVNEQQGVATDTPDQTESKNQAFIDVMKFLYLLVTLIKNECEHEEKNGAIPYVICNVILKNLNALYKNHKKKFAAYNYILNEMWDVVSVNKSRPAWDGFGLVIGVCGEMQTHILDECKSRDIDLYKELDIAFINGIVSI